MLRREVKFHLTNEAGMSEKWGDHIVFLFGISEGS